MTENILERIFTNISLKKVQKNLLFSCFIIVSGKETMEAGCKNKTI